MKKLYCLLSVLILTMVFFVIPVSADTGVVRRSVASNIRIFPHGTTGVPAGYKLAYVNYLTNNLNQYPYNPAYIYATYVPADCDYIIIPDTVSSDGVLNTNADVYLQGHMPDGSYAQLYTVITSYRSYDPNTNQPSANYDNYRLEGENGGYLRQPVNYNVLYMSAKRPNGSDFFEPTQLKMDTLLTDDKKLHFTCSITGDISQDVPIDFIMIPSSVDVGSTFNIQPDFDRSFYLTYDGTLYPSLESDSPLSLGEAFRNTIKRYVNPDAFVWWDDNSYSRLAIPIPYLADFQSVALPANFDINDYTADYVGIGGDVIKPSVHRTSVFTVDVPSMDNASANIPLYQYDTIGVIAVARYPNKIEVARFDFSRSQIMNSKHTPAVSHTPIDYIDSLDNITTLQDLADYMQYVYNTTNNNNYITYNNTIADLQSIPWDDYIATGIANGFANFMPNLSAEFDSLFGSLFDDFGVDFTIPSDSDLEAMQQLVDDAEDRFDQKTYWRVQIQNEVHYIITTCITAGDDPPVFNADMSDYHDIGFVTLFDARQIDSDTRDSVKEVITVFCSIGLVFYIFKTLPGTIGRTPSE